MKEGENRNAPHARLRGTQPQKKKKKKEIEMHLN